MSSQDPNCIPAFHFNPELWFEMFRCWWLTLYILYLSVGALSQYFKQLELRGVCFLTTFLHMVADVNLLKYTIILRKVRQVS